MVDFRQPGQHIQIGLCAARLVAGDGLTGEPHLFRHLFLGQAGAAAQTAQARPAAETAGGGTENEGSSFQTMLEEKQQEAEPLAPAHPQKQPAPEEAPAAADGFARRLRELDVDALSPMQALMLLCEWKKQAEENG